MKKRWWMVLLLSVFIVAICFMYYKSIPSTPKCALPAVGLSPAGGNFYGGPVIVNLGGSEKSQFYYTIDGTDPMASSNRVYSAGNAQIKVESSMMLKIVEFQETSGGGKYWSPVTTASYTILPFPVPIPTLTPPGGIYNTPQIMDITENFEVSPDWGKGEGHIYFTFDGTNPITSITRYELGGQGLPITGDIHLDSTTTLKAACVINYLFTNKSGDKLAWDSWSPVTTADYQITNPIRLVRPTLSPATIGNPYTWQFNAINGTSPYTFRAGGNIPPSLALTPDGLLSGIPAESGVFPFRIIINDARGFAIPQEVTLTVTTPRY